MLLKKKKPNLERGAGRHNKLIEGGCIQLFVFTEINLLIPQFNHLFFVLKDNAKMGIQAPSHKC